MFYTAEPKQLFCLNTSFASIQSFNFTSYFSIPQYLILQYMNKSLCSALIMLLLSLSFFTQR